MRTIHRHLLLPVALLALLVSPAAVIGADENAARTFTTVGVDDACQAAVAFLLAHQDEHGFFSDENPNRGGRIEADDRGALVRVPRHSAAMTALAIMGMSSVGHQPTDPTPEGRAMAKALDFMVREELQTAQGYYGQRDGSRMYGHGIITLMLAEMVGMGADEQQDLLLRDRTARAIDLILRSQAVPKTSIHRGGWRYDPHSTDSDISVTVWQLMALRAASNAGFDVPASSIARAVDYVKRSYRSDRDDDGRPLQLDRPFSYQAHGGDQQFSTTAAGILSLQVAGQYDALEVLGGANYLVAKPARPLPSLVLLRHLLLRPRHVSARRRTRRPRPPRDRGTAHGHAERRRLMARPRAQRTQRRPHLRHLPRPPQPLRPPPLPANLPAVAVPVVRSRHRRLSTPPGAMPARHAAP